MHVSSDAMARERAGCDDGVVPPAGHGLDLLADQRCSIECSV